MAVVGDEEEDGMEERRVRAELGDIPSAAYVGNAGGVVHEGAGLGDCGRLQLSGTCRGNSRKNGAKDGETMPGSASHART